MDRHEANVIDFDDQGNVCLIKKDWELDGLSDFSYRYLLNEWAEKNYEFVIGSNGICTENLFVDVPWQINRFHYKAECLYWWGEDLIKKIKKHRDGDRIVTGACPFVYTKEIYTKKPTVEPYLQAIFLPKTDKVDDAEFVVETQLDNDYQKRVRLQETIYGLDWDNPLFICAPYDTEYYSDMFPEDSLFSFSEYREDNEWNARLLALIQHCDKLYFQMLSTPAVFASYLGKDIEFYNTDILYLDTDEEEYYTLDKTRKPPIYHEFLEYIHKVFETKSSDMDFWIRMFLSLDRILPPDRLAATIHDSSRAPRVSIDRMRAGDIIREEKTPLYPFLRQHVAQFNRKPSDLAVYYFDLL